MKTAILSEEIYEKLDVFCGTYINKQCIVRCAPGVTMPGKIPGTTYTWQFYMRRGLFNNSFAYAISLLFLHKIEKEIGHFNFQLAGLETASTPMLTMFSLVAKMKYDIDINAFSIRKNRKEYGILNWIEGIPNEKSVIIIDDLCNSTNSLKKAYDICLEEGLTPFDHAYAIVNKVNRDSNYNTDKYLSKNIKVLYQYDLDDFDLKLNPNMIKVIDEEEETKDELDFMYIRNFNPFQARR